VPSDTDMIEIFTGKTVDDAKEQAVEKFGAAMKDIHFEILEEPRRGLFGRIKGEARVKAEYEPMMTQTPVRAMKPESEAAPFVPKMDLPEEELNAPKLAPGETMTVTLSEQKKAAPAPEASAPAQTAAPAQETAPVQAAPAEETAPAQTAAPAAEDTPSDEPLSPENEAKLKLAIDYISGILRQMGLSDAHTVTRTEGGVTVCFDGDGSGTLIGRRGDTLDALQYLAAMIANKGDKEYFRITLDSCGYREKRRKTLEDLAARICKSVLRTGRSTTLEPMNPYERRIIHSAVSTVEGVTSRSIGEEPFRKVVISSTNPRPERAERKGGNRRRDNRDSRPRRRDGEGPRKLDLSTSFEKDYKRPKPEDDINAGLYGKIEF